MKVLRSLSHLSLETIQVACKTKWSQQQNWLTLFFLFCVWLKKRTKQRQIHHDDSTNFQFPWKWHKIDIKDWIWVFSNVLIDFSIFENKTPNTLKMVSKVCSFIHLEWLLDQLRIQCEKKGISIWIPNDDDLSVFIVIMSINEESVNNHSVDFDD